MAFASPTRGGYPERFEPIFEDGLGSRVGSVQSAFD